MSLPFKLVIKFSVLGVIYSYGLWYGLMDVVSSFLPLGLLPALLVLLMIRLLRIPKPPIAQVEKIIGKDCFDESNDNNIFMRTIAHRGCGLDAPENSLIAFQMCAEKGQMFIEFDVRLTKDGVPVVFHDDNLNRVANINKKISDCSWDELQNFDISLTHPYHEQYKNTRIPTLMSTVKQLLDAGQNMFIDLKLNDHRLINIILETFQKYPDLKNRAIVTTFFPNLVYWIRRQNPNIVCAMAFRPYFFSHKSYSYPKGTGDRRACNIAMHLYYAGVNSVLTWCMYNISYYVIGLSVVLLHKDCISPQAIVDWHNKGVRVCAWTVNQIVEKQYYARILKCTYLTDTLTGESSTHLKV